MGVYHDHRGYMSFWKRLFGKRNQGDLTPPPEQPATTPPPAATTSPASSATLPNPSSSGSAASPAIKPGPQSAAAKDRVVRVFISSTFRDMQDERDILIKKIFPQLRKLCEERAVAWTEVDLRWGITTKESAEGKVLPLCLAEIHRCRPYFIGLLGERYGWVPDSIPADLLESQTWLKKHLQHSVTELEILHGVFSEEQMHGHAYFYFRDPKYVESVPDSNRLDFISESTEAAGKLVKLKQKIQSARDENICELRESYANPEQLGEWILEDFTALIDQLYPKDKIPDPLYQEAMRHEAYAQSRRLAFVGRSDLLRQMNDHVGTVDAKPLMLTGESGCGKSALLAEWVARWRMENPEDLIIQHYTGSTPESADWQGLVRRILGELKREFDITDELPMQPEALSFALNKWTVKAAGPRRVVLVLDGLNQLADDSAARQLGWLPVVFPTNFCVFVSMLPGESLDTLRKRSCRELYVPLFARADIASVALAYFKIFSKTPPKDILAKLESTSAACNALYLRAVLDELRQFGKHEELEAKAADYLSAHDLKELYLRILARWEQDFGVDLVRQSLSLIWAARHGLYEAELADLLGENDQPLPRAQWTPLYLAAEPVLASRTGLISFSHDYIRQAIKNRYLASETDQQEMHLHVADYFQSRYMNLRRVTEEPWQLLEAGALARLAKVISNLTFAHAIFMHERHDLLRYWARLEERTPCRIADTYQPVIEKPEQAQEHLGWVSYLLEVTGDKNNLLRLLEARERLARANADTHELLGCLEGLAVMYFHESRNHNVEEFASFDEVNQQKSMRLLREHEYLANRVGDKASLQSGLGTHAQLLIWSTQYLLARDLLKRQQQVCEQIDDRRGLARCFSNLAFVHNLLFEEKEALASFERAEDTCREVGDLILLTEILDSHGEVYKDLGRPYEAMALWQEEAKLAAALGFKRILRLALGKLDQTYSYLGADEAALLLLTKEEALCGELCDFQELERCQVRRQTIADTLSAGSKKLVVMQEFLRYDDHARRKGIVAMLKTIADSEAHFFPQPPVVADIVTHIACFLIADTLFDPVLASELAGISAEEYRERWTQACVILSPFGEALHRNGRFLQEVATDRDFRGFLQHVGSRLLYEVFPFLGYTEDEKRRAILPLTRCSLILMGDTPEY